MSIRPAGCSRGDGEAGNHVDQVVRTFGEGRNEEDKSEGQNRETQSGGLQTRPRARVVGPHFGQDRLGTRVRRHKDRLWSHNIKTATDGAPEGEPSDA